MNRRLLDILACPIDKQNPLELHAFETKNDVIVDGVLICTKCSRFFAIVEEIPIMLPDDLRDKNQEMAFLKKYEERVPAIIKNNANPWNLSR